MRIALLDPGLTYARGHHFDLDRRLFRALADRGHDVDLHGSGSPSPDLVEAAAAAGLPVRATFRVDPYAAIPAGRDPIAAYAQMAADTAQDLGRVAHADVWFWPTLFPFHLAAAVSAGAGVRQGAGVWWTPRAPHLAGARTWAQCARSLAAKPSAITVGAFDVALADAYRAFAPELALHTLPCPHDGAPRGERPARLRRIGFFGHQRGERGLDLLPGLVTSLIGRGYEVVVQDSAGVVGHRRSHPNLRVLRFVEDFGAEIAACDLVIWPSHWGPYALRYSGVVAECIASGVPVVVPSGCLPAALAARYGCALFFHEHAAQSILDTVESAAADFPAWVARAAAAAHAWHRENGTGRLADRIVSWASA